MKIYVHYETGLATTTLRGNAPVQSLSAKLGSQFELDVVFHNGAEPVELPDIASGLFAVKLDAKYLDAALFAIDTWAKRGRPSDGYRFAARIAGSALEEALGNKDAVTLMADITWWIGETRRATQKLGFILQNQIWRDDEPEIDDPETPWPNPTDLVTKQQAGTEYEPAQTAASQAEMEAGIETGIRKYSPLRIWQAINKGIGNLLSSVNTWTSNQVFNGTNNTLPNHSGLPPGVTTALNARQMAFEHAMLEVCKWEASPTYAYTATVNGGEVLLTTAQRNGILLRPKDTTGGAAKVSWNCASANMHGSPAIWSYDPQYTVLGIRFGLFSWSPGASSRNAIRILVGDGSTSTIGYADNPLSTSGFGFEIRNNDTDSAISIRLITRGSDNTTTYSPFVNSTFATYYCYQALLLFDNTNGNLSLYFGRGHQSVIPPARTPLVSITNSQLLGSSSSGRHVSVSTANNGSMGEWDGAILVHKLFLCSIPKS